MEEYIEQLLTSLNLKINPMIEIVLSCKNKCPICGGDYTKGVCNYCGKENEELKESINKIDTELRQLTKILENCDIKYIEINTLFNNLLKIQNYEIDSVNYIINKFNYNDNIKNIGNKISQNQELTDIEKNYLECNVIRNDPETNGILMNMLMVSISRGKKCIDYESFEKLFINHICAVLKTLNLQQSNCHIFKDLTSNGRKVNGLAIENSVALEKDILKNLYDGKDFRAMQTLYHEMRHTQQHKLLKNGCTNLYELDLIKEHILCHGLNNYYDNNYSNTLIEVDAEYYGIQYLLNYFQQLGIKMTSQSLQSLESQKEEYLKKMNEKTRVINGREINVDTLFDEFIKNKPELLKKYKQLAYQYKIEGQDVVPKDFYEKIADFEKLNSTEKERQKELYKELLLNDEEKNPKTI